MAIDAVGIAGVRYPTLYSRWVDGAAWHGHVPMSVSLPADRRGTHMSRMLELIHDFAEGFDPRDLGTMLKSVAAKLSVDDAEFGASMPMALAVRAPASGKEAWQPFDAEILGRLQRGVLETTTSVTAEVTSLCPCSKEISEYGAHNQRSEVTLRVHGSGDSPYPMSVSAAFDLIRDGRVMSRLSAGQADGRACHHDAGIRPPGLR